MSGPSRTSIRVRRFVRRRASPLRRVPEVTLLALAGLIVVGIVVATASDADWPEILRNEALNVASVAILAAFAYLLWVARFRNARLPAYLERFQRGGTGGWRESPDPLVAVIVNELLDARPPLACLVVGPRETARAELLADIGELLVSKRSAPVVIDVAGAASTDRLPILMRDRFVERLVGSAGDPQNGRRLFARLVRLRKVVGLVEGLDRVASGRPLAARRAAIADLLQTSVDEGIPFVACVDEGLAPSISEVAAFRVGPMPVGELVRYARDRLGANRIAVDHALEESLDGAFSIADPTRDPTFINLGIDLLARRVRRGKDSDVAATELFEPQPAFVRHLGWMCEWALDRSIDEVGALDSPAARALAVLGIEAHHSQRSETELNDILNALDTGDRQRISAGIGLLSRRGVVLESDGGHRLQFTHPAWLAFAGSVGLRSDPARWADLLRSGPSTVTLDALRDALWIFGGRRRSERSFLRALDGFLADGAVAVTLEMALAVITVLQVDDRPLRIQEDERAALERGWRSTEDVVRKRFVSEVDLRAQPDLIAFLWSQVVPPRFGENSFAVRRAICRRLGGLGNATWGTLRRDWIDLVDRAGSIDLATRSYKESRSKGEPWPGSAVASLAWVLPQLLLSATGAERAQAFELLTRLRDLVGGNQDLPMTDGPDIGLEISLAEGFKSAADGDEARGIAWDDPWITTAIDLLRSSRSWISQQALLQALGLACPASDAERLRRRLEDYERSTDRHPFVRETAALVSGQIGSRVAAGSQDVWIDDQETRDDGGVSLSKPAHRLLALSTLLIVMAERRLGDWVQGKPGETEEAVEDRERAFVDAVLPRCFSDPGFARTMFDTECGCSYGFCGPSARRPIVEQQRRFTRSFAQRAQVAAAEPAVARVGGRSLFVTKGFEETWGALDDELVLAERRAASS